MAKEITKSIEQTEWYQSLITDLQRLKYEEQADLIISKWKIGDRLDEEKDEGITKILTRVSVDSGLSERELWFCLHFRRHYPKLTEEIKQESWRKLSRGLKPFPLEAGFGYKLFDVWNFQGCDEKYGDPTFPGRIPGQLIKNILYYFTETKDVVVDPMSGGGTTFDVCKEMNRECLAYDIDPIRDEIKKWDLGKGFPKEAKNCDLIFLDPPYWKKKMADYTKNSISKFDRESYLEFFKKLAIDCYEILKIKGILAFLMSNYIDYKKPEESIFTADYYQFFQKAGFKVLYEIQTPLSTQQYNDYDVERAKKEKKILIISRSLYIFQKYG